MADTAELPPARVLLTRAGEAAGDDEQAAPRVPAVAHH